MDKTNEIDRNAHYFTLMHPLEGCIIPGYCSILYTSSNTREKWVECEIVEDTYKIEDGYKVELSSLEPGYGREKYYIDDFLSFLESGHIVKKVPGMECVEETWEEPLTPTVNLRHSAYVLKMVKQNTTKKRNR